MPQPPELLPGLVQLPAHCGTVAAEDLRIQLVMAADCDAGTTIDAGAVQSLGQAVLQLLVSGRNGALGAGRTFQFTDMSPAFAEQVQGCCLAGLLGIDPAGSPMP